MTSILSEYLDQIKTLIAEGSMPSRKMNHENSLSETGCLKNTVLVQGRNGDFFGFSVKALEPIKPLFTEQLLLDAIELYQAEEFDAIVRLFDIKEEFLLYGYSVIDYVILKYLELNKLKLDKKIKLDFTLPELDKRLKLIRSDAILSKLEIVNVGNNVVPSDWIGRQFDNAVELHKQIDSLDYRKGKPPVTYCCIYNMTVTEQKIVQLVKNIPFKENEQKQTIFIQLETDHTAGFLSSLDKLTKSSYVQYENDTHRMIVAFEPNEHFVSNIELGKHSVGLLSSTLQKCIRHGRCSIDLLKETVQKLARAKPYNLPEQNYLKVSGSRQLFWRSFITIIEDFRYYHDPSFLSLFDLLTFALICNKEPDYVICDELLEKVKSLLVRIAECDDTIDYHEWRTYSIGKTIFSVEQSIPLKTIFISDQFVPKMSGDSVMIQRYATLLKTYQPLPLLPNLKELVCKKCEAGFTTKYTSVDIHCYPNMILHLQGSIREQKTTQQLSSMIWELNSKYNNRRPDQFIPEMFSGSSIKTIFNIQKDYWGEYKVEKQACKASGSHIEMGLQDQEKKTEYIESTNTLTPYQRRSLFLKLFGQKLKIKSKRVLEVIFHVDDLFRIKYVNSDEFLKDEEYEKESAVVWDYLIKNKIDVTIPDCLVGYQWICSKKIQIGVTKDKKPFVIYGSLKKKVVELDWFDGSPMVVPVEPEKTIEPISSDNVLIKNLLRINKMGDLFKCNWIARNSMRKNCISLRDQRHPLFSSILVKLFTANDNVLEISQVTRNGEKVDNSVDYEREGVIWSLCNLLHYCYPEAITVSGDLKFRLHPQTSQYLMLLEDLDVMCGRSKEIGVDSIAPIVLQTKLWEHQKNTVEFILKNVALGKRGFGDASNVGAGKTLSALSTISELYMYNRQKKVFALILLPTEKLYKTWRDEISKHYSSELNKTIGVLEQQANGTLKGTEVNGLNLIITTMGRNRDHLIEQKWLFVVIDECLTVQNKEAQQTMSAWIQSIHSKFGILLLSATFFRTRFDKLLYMLKMLNCQLPETKEYLDTILCDSIKVHLPASKREWTESIVRYQIDSSKRKVYDAILNSDLSNEMKYVQLNQFIREHIDYCDMFRNTIQSLEKDKKALIYAESKLEAEQFSKNIPDVGLYPDITKKHVVVSYANGTYGLNDLTGCNVLVTRPPEPDKLPQMKGRLDRPGQLSNQLNIVYILLENTIEEASYLRIDLCNKFYSNHIMPLSEFYSLALK